MNQSRNLWLWVVPLLLLLAFIVTPRLEWDGLWYDEIFSVINSRGAGYGPVSIEAIWTQVTQNDPHQALGYPYLLALWGLGVGWTEFALRAFSMLAAALAVAATYQLGKRFVSAEAGLLAALILAISSYFINYAHELRSFSFVALAAVGLLWSYEALLRTRKSLPKIPALLFVLSGMALLWSHYYTAMLLVGLGLYHLLFAKKDKRWLQITGLALLLGLLFLPQLPSFIKGYTVFSPEDVEIAPLSAWGVVSALAYFIGNNLTILTILAFGAGLFVAWKEAPRLRSIILIVCFSMGILLLSNEILGILEPTRLRYAIFLWPLLALWLGAGLLYLGRLIQNYMPANPLLLRGAMLLLPMLWLANGIWANYQADFNAAIVGDEVPRLRLMSNELAAEASSADVLLFYNGTNRQTYYIQLGMEYALTGQPADWIFSSSLFHESDEEIRLWAQGQIDESQRVWYGVNRLLPLNELHPQTLDLLESQFIACGNRFERHDISLDLYARSAAFCPTDSEIARFGNLISLRAHEQTIENRQLDLNLNWELSAETPPDSYSLGVYIMPQGVSDLLLQADVGFPNERHVMMPLTIDLSNLPAGFYDVWLGVYHWQTAERLAPSADNTLWLLSTIAID